MTGTSAAHGSVVGRDEGPTRRLADFIANLALEDVPDEIVERTRYLILDGIACGLVGAHLPWSETAVEAISKLDGPGSSSIWGWGRTTNPSSAALLNGSFVQGFELDDIHGLGPLHGESVVLPAAFSTAEALGAVKGDDLLLAIILGFEIGPRVGLTMDGHYLVSKGWHCGSVYGTIAAAAAAAKVRQLSADGVEDTIGIAATQSCGLMSAQYEAMVKRMNHGFSGRAGVVAAALADSGYSGIKRVLERPYGGLVSTFVGERPSDFELMAGELGTRWEIERIIVKPYAANGSCHPSIDAMLHARQELGIRADDIAKIEISLSDHSMKHIGWELQRPAEVVGAQLNVTYIAAVTMLDGAALMEQFTPSRINDDDVWELMGRIETRFDPEVDKLAKERKVPRATWVDLTLRDGSRHHIEVLEAVGQGKKILTNDQVLRKYHDLMSAVAPAGRAEAIQEAVMGLGPTSNVLPLLQLVAEPVKAPF